MEETAVVDVPNKFARGRKKHYLVPDIAGILRAYDNSKGSFGPIAIPGDIRETDKVCLWEMGGLHTNGRGIAMIVGTPDGKLIDRPISFNRTTKPNGRQALTNIWPGCIVAIGGYDEGVHTVLVFEITNLTNGEEYNHAVKIQENNAMVILNLIGYFKESWRLTVNEVPEMYHTMKDVIVEKLKTKQMTTAAYMNPWSYCRKSVETYKVHFASPLPEDMKVTEVADFGAMVGKIEKKIRSLKSERNCPIRQLITDNGDGTFVVDMVVISPDADKIHKANEARKADNVPDEELESAIVSCFRTTVTPDTKVPMNITPFMKAPDYAEFKRCSVKGDLQDNWLIFRG